MAGVDARTGKPLTDWAHVGQSLQILFATRFGERVMRRHFGSPVIGLLGQLATPQNVLRFYSAVAVAVELWEPRYKITGIGFSQADAAGRARVEIIGIYRPRGHLGDFTAEGSKVLTLSRGDNGLEAA